MQYLPDGTMFKAIFAMKPLSRFFGVSILSLGALCLSPSLSVGVWAATPNAKANPEKLAPKTVVISVGTQSIRKSQIDTLVDLMLRAKQAQGAEGPEARRHFEILVATNLIGQELLDLEAKTQKLTLADKEVDSAFMAFRGKFPDANAFAMAMKQTGESEATLKQKLVRQLKADKLLNGQVGQLEMPSDKEIETFFNQNKKQFPISDSLRACQILLQAPKGTPASESDKKRKQLENVRKELVQDSASPFLTLRKFLMIASKLGEGPEKQAGGDLQRFKPSDFHPDFSSQLKSLKVGELSNVFRSPLGWHLVILTERNDGKLDSYKLPIAQLLMSQKSMQTAKDMRKYLQTLAAKYKVKYLVNAYKDTTATAVYH
jgi:parvulin-like peptidyl-prolyl isomerase